MQIVKQSDWRDYCIKSLKENNVQVEKTPGGAFKIITGRAHVIVTDLVRLSPLDLHTITRGRA